MVMISGFSENIFFIKIHVKILGGGIISHNLSKVFRNTAPNFETKLAVRPVSKLLDSRLVASDFLNFNRETSYGKFRE